MSDYEHSILPLYFIIRRPTHILDFALTLIFNHFILTTYYSASFPTSIFYWLVQACGAVLMVVSAEAVRFPSKKRKKKGKS